MNDHRAIRRLDPVDPINLTAPTTKLPARHAPQPSCPPRRPWAGRSGPVPRPRSKVRGLARCARRRLSGKNFPADWLLHPLCRRSPSVSRRWGSTQSTCDPTHRRKSLVFQVSRCGEMADAADLKSADRKVVRVRVPPSAPMKFESPNLPELGHVGFAGGIPDLGPATNPHQQAQPECGTNREAVP
jgi:hypothetical protein